MKKNFILILAAIMSCGFILISCHDNDDIPAQEEEQGATEPGSYWAEGIDDFVYDIKYDGKVFIAAALTPKQLEVINKMMPNQTTNLSEAKVAVLNSINDLSWEDTEALYWEGAEIVLLNPVKAEIEQWFKDHTSSEDCPSYMLDGARFYAFDVSDYHYIYGDDDGSIVNKNNFAQHNEDGFYDFMETTDYDEDDYDVEPEEGVDYKTIELNMMFSQWLEDLMEMESGNLEAETKAITRAAGDEGMKVEDCFKLTTLTKSFPYDCYMNMKFDSSSNYDKVKSNNYDKIKFGGKATISVTYSVYQLHVYDGQPGSGDYYVVTMNPQIANGEVFSIGLKKMQWYLANAKYCGPFCKEFIVQSTPVDSKGNAYSTSSVLFPGTAQPIPTTDTGKTEITEISSFSIKGDVTAGYSAKAKPTGDVSVSKDISGTLSVGWNWETKVKRDVGDISIINQSPGTNVVKHQMLFYNLPERKFNYGDYGYKETPNNNSYKSTKGFRAAWIWKKVDVSDDSTEDPISIRFKSSAKYGGMYHTNAIGKDAIAREESFGNFDFTFNLDPMIREPYAIIKLQNDFEKGMYITNIVVEDKKSGQVVSSSNKSYNGGETINMGALPQKGEYTVSFKAGKNASDMNTYHYVTNDKVPMNWKEPTVLKAAFDFKIEDIPQ